MARAIEKATAMPEVVVATRSDNNSAGAWSVEAGSSNRGDASTNFADRVMRIPLSSDEVGKIVRGHELIHAKVSPTDTEALSNLMVAWGTNERVMMTAEEYRVNTLLGRAGYDLDLLTDGSEKQSGITAGKEALADPERYNEAICFGVALMGTKAFRQYLAGVKKHNPELGKTLRSLELAVLKITRNAGTKELASTSLDSSERWTSIRRGKPAIELLGRAKDAEGEDIIIGKGFGRYVARIVATMELYLVSIVAPDEVHNSTGRAGVEYPIGNKGGEFAPLLLDTTVICDQQVKGHLGRKKKPTTTGKALRYPERLLTDPQRRIFSTKQRSSGGVVLIDQSGSMDLTEDDLERLLELSPSALVIGYSHKPRSKGVPNAWVIANRGHRVATGSIPSGNIGNGVDGPVLDYAIANRRGNEPVIWVFDGQATDAIDNSQKHLTEAIARMVHKHRVTVAPTMELAVEALGKGKNARSKYCGRLANAMNDLYGVPIGR